jgi:hypothetical protein
LGQDRLRDTFVSKATATYVSGGATYNWLSDNYLLYTELSDNSLFAGAWMSHTPSGAAGSYPYRVTGFDPPRLILNYPPPYNVYPGDAYEIHEMVSPDEKDLALDRTLRRVWSRQEVPIWAVNGQQQYSLGQSVGEIFDVYVYGNPAGSLDRGRGALSWWGEATTATGREVRVTPAPLASQQLILDAQVWATLGAADTATVNIPDVDWILDGAAAVCYEILGRRSPGQEAGAYATEAKRYGRAWMAGQGRWLPAVTRKVELETPW